MPGAFERHAGGTSRLVSGATEMPADGQSSTRLVLAVSNPTAITLTMRLRGRGSFDPHTRLQTISVPVQDGLAAVAVYAPRRPGQAVLSTDRLRLRLSFRATSALQSLLHDWTPTLVLSLVLALLLRGYAFASFFIPSPSMENTLMIGDRLIAEKFSYTVLKASAQRGDIVLFHPPHVPEEVWIKRCIGLPGDKIEASDGTVYVNGEALDEQYIAEPPHRDFGPLEVPAGHYFVMGDNRNDSTDSRSWGPLPAENLIGRAVVVVWPPDHAHLLTNPLAPSPGQT